MALLIIIIISRSIYQLESVENIIKAIEHINYILTYYN